MIRLISDTWMALFQLCKARMDNHTSIKHYTQLAFKDFGILLIKSSNVKKATTYSYVLFNSHGKV